jgi:outer membrane lipoprotein-sorting protein
MTARAVFALALLLSAGSACAATADELIAKNIAARGGMDKLQAIKTLKMQGQLLAGGGFKLAYSETLKRPDKIRDEASVQGLTQVQAWDGQHGWSIQPFGGRKDPIPMSADDAKELAEGADIDGAWVNAAAKGSTVTYLGTEDVDGTSAHKLQVQLKDGNTLIVYLDPDAYLPIREIARRTVRGTQQVTQTDFGDYEQVNGVYFPFAITTGPKEGGDDSKVRITFDTAQANVPVDDSIFVFPEKNANAAGQGSH